MQQQFVMIGSNGANMGPPRLTYRMCWAAVQGRLGASCCCAVLVAAMDVVQKHSDAMHCLIEKHWHHLHLASKHSLQHQECGLQPIDLDQGLMTWQHLI